MAGALAGPRGGSWVRGAFGEQLGQKLADGFGAAAVGYSRRFSYPAVSPEVINQTDKTQPAMLAAGVAVWRIWRERSGQTPAVMANAPAM